MSEQEQDIKLSAEDLREIRRMTGQRTPWAGDMSPHLGQSPKKWVSPDPYKGDRKS